MREFQAALYDIWRYELWRESGDADFRAYLHRRWGYQDRYIRYMTAKMRTADGVIAALQELGTVEIQLVHDKNGTPVPRVQSAPEIVARPLQDLPSAPLRAEAWVKAVELAHGDMPTETQVKEAVTAVRRESMDSADQRLVEQHRAVYPFIATMLVKDAAALVNLLNGVARRVRDMAVMVGMTDQALIRELNRIVGSDSFDEIEATGLLQWSDGSTTPITRLNASTLRAWLDERKRAHIQISYDAATATYTLPLVFADAHPVTDDDGVIVGRRLVFDVPLSPTTDEMIDRMRLGGRYDVQIRVVERTK